MDRFLIGFARLNWRDSPLRFGISFNGVGGPLKAPFKIAWSRCDVSLSAWGFAMSKAPDAMPPKAEFFMYVGHCITAWAKVEDELFKITMDVLGCTLVRASIVYYRVPALSSRLDLVDELVAATALPQKEKENGGHDSEEVKTWAVLKNSINAQLKTRSQIAHHPVDHGVGLRNRKSGEVIPIPIGQNLLALGEFEFHNSYWIYMSQHERLRGRKVPKKPLRTEDLSIHCVQVQKLADDLKTFRTRTLTPLLQAAAQQEAEHQSGPGLPNTHRPISRRQRPKSRGG